MATATAISAPTSRRIAPTELPLRPETRWTAAVCAVTALIALPLLSPGWLPFTDLGEHAAAMGTFAHFDDPGYALSEHYRVAWTSSQYLLTHLVGGMIARVLGVEVTVKVILVGLAVAWMASSRMLLRAFGGDPRLAIPGALLFWNRALGLGFLPYLASLPLLFLTLAWFVRTAAPRPRRRTAGLALAGLIVFYTHASAFTLLAGTVGAVALTRFRGVRHLVRDVAWLLPASIAAVTWLVRGRFAMHDGERATAEIGTMSPLRALKVIPIWSHDIWPSHVDDAIGIAFWTVFLVLLLGQRRVDWRSAVPFAVALAIYLATPFRVGAGVLLNVRMGPVLALLALLVLRPARGLRGSLPIAACTILALVQCVDNAQHVRRLQADVHGVPELLAKIPRGAKLLSLHFSGFDANVSHTPPWIYAGSYHRANAGGIASFSFSELPHWSVHYRPETAPPAQGALAWAMRPCLFRNHRDGPYFDWVLVRGDRDPFAGDPPGPHWTVAGRTAKFVLWQKDGTQNPDGPDDGPCKAESVSLR